MSVRAAVAREQRLHDEVWRRARRREAARGASIAAGRALVLALALGGWAVVAGRFGERTYIGDPAGVARAFWGLVASGRLWPNLVQTVGEVLSGYAIGAAFGIVVAVVVAFEETVQRVLRPFLIAAYSVPKIALAPLFVMWFGLGVAPKIVLVVLFVFFVVFMNTAAGLYQVNPQLVDVVRVMGARRTDVVWKIALPSTVPYLITGLRIAIPEALVGAVIGEFIAANRGLGYLVNEAANELNVSVTMAAIAALLLIVVAMDIILGAVERRLLRWRQAQGAPIGARE